MSGIFRRRVSNFVYQCFHSLARKWHAGLNRDEYLKLATELRGDIYAQVRNVVMREVPGQ